MLRNAKVKKWCLLEVVNNFTPLGGDIFYYTIERLPVFGYPINSGSFEPLTKISNFEPSFFSQN